MLLSIVVPCYNEQEMVPLLWRALTGALASLHDEQGLDSEVILVDDGSSDATLSELRGLAADPTCQGELSGYLPVLRYRSFSRNFGKEAALSAGFLAAAGELVAVMDADLQDPPELLAQRYEKLKAGTCDVVAARRVTREGEPPIRSVFARLFYRLMGDLSKTEVVDAARDFRMMTRRVVDAVLSLPERSRFSKGIFSWVGFRTEWIEYRNVERAAGETSWSFWGLVRYSIEGIVSFSIKPLHLASGVGLTMSLLALVAIVVIIVRTLAFGDPVAGWPSLACLVTLVGGITLLSTGILGEYLARVYLEVKQRPLFLVAEEGSSQEPENDGAA